LIGREVNKIVYSINKDLENNNDREKWIGKIFNSKKYGDFIFLGVHGLGYQNKKLYICKFINTGYETLSTGGNIKKQELKDCLFPTVYNIGKIGYIKNPQLHEQYERWIRMLQRCYDGEYHKIEVSYKDVVVDERWHRFDYFVDDVPKIKGYKELKQYNNINFEIDKDIFAVNNSNKIYTLEQCCFVPKEINNLFRRTPNTNTSGYMGVSYNKNINKYKVALGKKYLGVYKSAEEAFKIYCEYKYNILIKMLNKYDFLLPSIKIASLQKMKEYYIESLK